MSFADRSFAPDPNSSEQAGDVVLGDDWVAPESTVEKEMRVKRARRGLLSLKASPLTR
ncbi:MAG: histidine kinase, partial [Paracoccaceae bacterium]